MGDTPPPPSANASTLTIRPAQPPVFPDGAIAEAIRRARNLREGSIFEGPESELPFPPAGLEWRPYGDAAEAARLLPPSAYRLRRIGDVNAPRWRPPPKAAPPQPAHYQHTVNLAPSATAEVLGYQMRADEYAVLHREVQRQVDEGILTPATARAEEAIDFEARLQARRLR